MIWNFSGNVADNKWIEDWTIQTASTPFRMVSGWPWSSIHQRILPGMSGIPRADPQRRTHRNYNTKRMTLFWWSDDGTTGSETSDSHNNTQCIQYHYYNDCSLRLNIETKATGTTVDLLSPSHGINARSRRQGDNCHVVVPLPHLGETMVAARLRRRKPARSSTLECSSLCNCLRGSRRVSHRSACMTHIPE